MKDWAEVVACVLGAVVVAMIWAMIVWTVVVGQEGGGRGVEEDGGEWGRPEKESVVVEIKGEKR